MWRNLIVLAAWGLVDAGVLQPATVPFADLADGARAAAVVGKALREDGLIQISGIPGYSELRKAALTAAHACIEESPRARAHTFVDGTVRRTLMAASSIAFGERPIEHGSAAEACRALERSLQMLRQTVGEAADVFAKSLDAVLGPGAGASAQVLRQRGEGSSGYSTLAAAVRAGGRIETFHTYKVQDTSLAHAEEHTLMDFHVDTGLFIAFAPAMMVNDAALPQASASSGAFVIRTQTGQEMEVALHEDALVLLLGDGANQYMHKVRPGAPLHAPSHAFRMPRGASGLHRVWYGMMQLPPADAEDEEKGLTFGEIRQQMARAASLSGAEQEAVLALGCSRTFQARELAAQSCADNQLYCWHRCMNYTAAVSPEACAAQNLAVKCVNQFDQVYISGHGDFHPTCTNSTTEYAPRPSVVQPVPTCANFPSLVVDSTYAQRVALVADQTYLLWNVVGNEIEAKMVHNGIVGWMAVGLESIGGVHNGMNGAEIVMGRNFQGQAPTVEEYKIHPFASAFRNWKTPLSPSALQDTAMEITGCFSSIKFRTASLYNQPLNVTSGSNRMIWALTHLDYPTDDFGGYSGYHSSADGDPAKRGNHRGKITVDFNNDGKASSETSLAASRVPFRTVAAAASVLAALRGM